MATNKILEVKDLVISFKTDRGIVHAVRGVNFDLYKGETLCIVGESGSGKSVTNKAVMGISAKNAIIESGSILYEGEDLVKVSEEEFHRIRGHKIGMIFQDPLSALNPVMRIGKQIIEATMINKDMFKRKFGELTAKELTEYRNDEADYNYNISKINNEIGRNEKTIEDYNTASRTLNKINAAIEKCGANEDKANALKDEAKSYQAKIDDYVFNYNEFVNSTKKQIIREIEGIKDTINSLEAKETKIDIESRIKQDAINKNNEILNFMSKPEFSEFSDDLVASLTARNQILTQFAKLYKVQFKKCEPALKENYKLSKEKAKKEVAEYKKQITNEHNAKVAELNSKLNEVDSKIATLRNALSPEQLKEIDDVVLFNEALKKRLAKESKKFRETSISKTVKKDNDPKEIPNVEYAELIAEKEEINKQIIAENDDFVSKTVVTKAQAKKMALEVMREVGIPMPERRFRQYPFEFSGGMRQRIVIAIALTANPEILICDEPTTALDVTIQAQILELINRLKAERNLSCIFITHDLGVVANMADRVAVMYAGKIVEYGTAEEVFFDPKHPYTWALLSSIPDVDSKEKLDAIPGTPPDMIYPPKGDAFALRSKYAMEIDFKAEPPYFKLSDTHYAATWLLHPDAPKVEMPKIVQERIKNAKATINGGK